MNCTRFQNRLFEYVEGTLSPSALAAAHRHLARCDACRQLVCQERQLARCLSESVRRATETLTLKPEVERRILRALETQTSPLTGLNLLRRLLDGFSWPQTLAACFLLMGAFLIANVFYRARVHGIGANGSSDRYAQAARPPEGTGPFGSPDPVVVEVSYRVPTRRSRAEGNLVQDSLSVVTVTARGTLWIGEQEPKEKRTTKNQRL